MFVLVTCNDHQPARPNCNMQTHQAMRMLSIPWIKKVRRCLSGARSIRWSKMVDYYRWLTLLLVLTLCSHFLLDVEVGTGFFTNSRFWFDHFEPYGMTFFGCFHILHGIQGSLTNYENAYWIDTVIIKSSKCGWPWPLWSSTNWREKLVGSEPPNHFEMFFSSHSLGLNDTHVRNHSRRNRLGSSLNGKWAEGVPWTT